MQVVRRNQLLRTAVAAASVGMICQAEADPTLQRKIAGTEMIQAVQEPEPHCDLSLEVSGGAFSPDYCKLEIISGGAICRDPKECGPRYAVNLRNSRPGPGEIMSVVLFGFRELKTGTYKVDATIGSADFEGQLIDKDAAYRHLLGGTVTLNWRGGVEAHISCDVHFANDISVLASGLIQAERLNAP